MGSPNYRNGFELAIHPETLELPLHWKRPQVVFVNSMSDLFHRDVPFDFIKQTFEVMQRAHWHTFQILTKRADHLAEIAPRLPWPRNVWMGVSVETPAYVHRIHDLCRVPAAVRFLSVEPLLAPIPRIPLTGIDWVIVGGESGPGCRPMEADWVRAIRDRCLAQSVPFFFKQWGGIHKKRFGRTLDGRTWDELPEPKSRRWYSAASVPVS